MKTLLFNPEYHLRQDGNRVILFSDDEVSEIAQEWFSFIHPYQAMMLSFFNGQEPYQQEIMACAEFFRLSYGAMRSVIRRFTGKTQWFTVRSGNHYLNFPRNVLIETEQGEAQRSDRYSPLDFKYMGDPDYSTYRLVFPMTINIELTMRCYADCIYCYANKHLQDRSMLSLADIERFVREAKAGGVFNIDINGGDVVLHPHIREILHILVDNGYKPLVSTKTVLEKDFIDYVRSLGQVRLQLSLDAANPAILREMIGVGEDYLPRVACSLAYLSEIGMPININAVITRHNADLSEIRRLLDFVSQYSAVRELRFNPCGYSLYKSNYAEIVLTAEQMQDVSDAIEQMAPNYPLLSIKFSSFDKSDEYEDGHKAAQFKHRALCTGGTRNAVLLPNGDMTICEELYDHPAFILGNVRHSSIADVWNSDKALKLYRTPIRATSSSACGKCPELQQCRTGCGVCWKMVLMAYGKDNWDYPDPRCPKAPPPFHHFYYE